MNQTEKNAMTNAQLMLNYEWRVRLGNIASQTSRGYDGWQKCKREYRLAAEFKREILKRMKGDSAYAEHQFVREFIGHGQKLSLQLLKRVSEGLQTDINFEVETDTVTLTINSLEHVTTVDFCLYAHVARDDKQRVLAYERHQHEKTISRMAIEGGEG